MAESIVDYSASLSGHHGEYQGSVFSFSKDTVRAEQTGRSCFLLSDSWQFVLSDSNDDVHGLFRDGHKMV